MKNSKKGVSIPTIGLSRKKNDKQRKQITVQFSDSDESYEAVSVNARQVMSKDHESRLVFYASLSSTASVESTRIKRPRAKKISSELNQSVRKFAEELESASRNDKIHSVSTSASELELALDRLKLSKLNSNTSHDFTTNSLPLLKRSIPPKSKLF